MEKPLSENPSVRMDMKLCEDVSSAPRRSEEVFSEQETARLQENIPSLFIP